MSAYREELKEYIRTLRIISTHNHHLNDTDYTGIGLADVLSHSYVNWASCPPAINDGAAWKEYILKNRTNSFFRWLFEALESIYGIPVTPETIPALDAAVRKAYTDPDHHIRLLTENCRYDAVINERQPHPGDDLGHPELFKPAFRCDCFFSGYDADRPEPNGFLARSLFRDKKCRNLEAYLSQMDEALSLQKEKGIRALKVAIAYERDLCFGTPDLLLARDALNNRNASPEQIHAFGDLVMDRIADSAAYLGLPLQIHTGTGQYRGTNPIGLLGLIRRHPETKFHLLHGGFPWTDDLFALLLAFPNVYSDTCWIPYLSTSEARRYLVTALEVSDAHRLTWGCDTWMPEDSVGALLAMEHTLSNALDDMIGDGAMDPEYAKYVARRILHDNACEIFPI